MRVLIVDDNQNFRERLARAFRDRGYETDVASRHIEAMEVAGAVSPDLAVVDLRMPGPSGLETVKALRARNARTRILVLTGYGSIATAVEAVRLGANNYLAKPADVDEILRALSEEGAAAAQDIEEQDTPSLARVEWEHIHRVLADCDGNLSEASRRLGIHRRSLQRKLQKYPPRT
jgi:two-component system response regulator RegA